MALDISRIVDVNAILGTSGVTRRVFGTGLLVTENDKVPVAGSGAVQTFADLTSAAELFTDADDDAYTECARWFGQTPFPKNLSVVRHVDADTASRIVGGTPAVIGTLTAISDGSITIGSEEIDSINFSSDTTFADVAGTLQTAIRTGSATGLSTATVTYDSTGTGRLIVEFPNNTNPDQPYEFEITDGSTGTNVADHLGLTEDQNAVFELGAAQETFAETLARAVQSSGFYFIITDLRDFADLDDISEWAETGRYIFSAETNEEQALEANDSTSAGAQLAAQGRNRTWISYSSTRGLASSIAAYMSHVNFRGQRTLPTAMFKRAPGITAADLTPAQANELTRKRINFYAEIGGVPIYQEGWLSRDGAWVDSRYWVDWFANAIETEVLTMLTSDIRIPATNAGVGILQAVINKVCVEGVRNGGIAPGNVSAAMRARIQSATEGNDDFDGFLPTGYLVSIGRPADLSQSDRNARQAPPVTIYLKGSSAIHHVEVDVRFEE